MLLLTFQLGRHWYAVPAAQVVEILPRLECKEIPHALASVVGVFDYHGQPVPVIDLAALSLGIPSRPRMSTRIIVVEYSARTGDQSRRLGLIAEQATETIRRDAADFIDPGVAAEEAPYLGPVTKDVRGLIQLIHPTRLLPQSLCDRLFREPLEV